MGTSKISWLHLSDLHILLNSPSWENYRNSMLRIFESNDFSKPDFVVITGDYRVIGKGNPFELAENFIRKIIDVLKLDISKDLFLIPGNHDTLPQQDEDGALERRTNELQQLLPKGLLPWERDEDKDVDMWLRKHENDPEDYIDRLCNVSRSGIRNKNAVSISVLEDGFEQYQSMVKRLIPWYRNFGWNPASPHFRDWKSSSGLGFNVVHLNTALVADGGRCHYQALDLHKAQETFEQLKNGLPTLVLAHNGFYDLHPQIREFLKEPMGAARVCAWLCGDSHKFNTGETISCFTKNGSYSVPIFVCGRGAPDHGDDYSDNGFILYKSDGENLTSQRFIWTKEQGFTGQEGETNPLAAPENRSTISEGKHPFLIGYLSCNPNLSLEEKYHLGHAYFIHSIDKRLKQNYNVMILTSSYVFSHNRSLQLLKQQTEYVEEMIRRWEDCFERKVKVIDIKQYLQEENPLDEKERSLLQYIAEMEMKLDRNTDWMSFIETWKKNGSISDIAYNSIMKIAEADMGNCPTTYTRNELMSFFYLLYKRPSWYSNTWLVNFLHFWTVQLYPLIKSEFNCDVKANDIFIIEAQRNHYVWDAISYCAKRFSYTNVPKIKCLENLLDTDCRQPMKSSIRDKTVFLAGCGKTITYTPRFRTHIKNMFGEDKTPDEIAKEYSQRLGL